MLVGGQLGLPGGHPQQGVVLEAAAGVSLTVSAIDFGGGIRAVIRARNILIDESFVTQLEQEEASL